jgi:hypothetical protein
MNVFYLAKRKIFKFYKSHYKYRLHYTVLLIKVNEKDVTFWVLCCGCWFLNSNHNNPFWSSFLVLYIGIGPAHVRGHIKVRFLSYIDTVFLGCAIYKLWVILISQGVF